LAEKLAGRILGDEAPDFLQALFGGRDYGPCGIWVHPRPDELPLKRGQKPDWAPEFVDFFAMGERPGQSSHQEDGSLYVLDPSSVAEASVLQKAPSAQTILDVCSAPGGKGIFAWRMFQPELLVANDPLSKRLGMLSFNLERCRIAPSIMTSVDPAGLSDPLEGQFDLVIVDAPCSGQSMAAKGKESGGGFHPATVNMNSNRQKRILGHSARCVRPGGHLAYMTCTYSPEENEQVVAWLLKKYPEFKPVPLGAMEPLQSHLTDLPCVRIWPHRGPGAGGFSCLLRREGGEEFELNRDWLESRALPRR
jgi:16S rRNA C967 or C1407 C5-methylase (RsmB/RsmF family)